MKMFFMSFIAMFITLYFVVVLFVFAFWDFSLLLEPVLLRIAISICFCFAIVQWLITPIEEEKEVNK